LFSRFVFPPVCFSPELSRFVFPRFVSRFVFPRAVLHAHLGVNAIVVVFPIGLIFGFVYWRWRQLWPLVVAHALFDLYALFPRAHAA
jgi:membrane protease YdiL (CAAX protease family)